MQHELENGTQPLDEKMTALGLENHDIVAASPVQLSHKMVAKGRSGRWLSLKIRQKILTAFCKASKTEVSLQDLFNYR